MVNKEVYSFVGDNCFYFVKDKNQYGLNIIRPPTDAEIEDEGNLYIDKLFFVESKEELDLIFKYSVVFAENRVPESFKYRPKFIPKEFLTQEIRGARFYMTFTNTNHTWKMEIKDGTN